ncbi:MAG: helix-turn-helix domain-containing protein [Chloroflexi bacterium]|nr:helix-turn-helix domain-containing protein [Chloroflexota bacterium]
MGGVLRRPITGEERLQLLAWQHSSRTTLYVRARTLLLAESAPSATAIAEALGIHVQTVRETLRRFTTNGLAGVKLKPRPGRPNKLGESAADVLIAMLHDRPARYGVDDARWTLGTAASTLARELRKDAVSVDTIRRLLKRSRHSWQRAKEWIESPDPKYTFKKSGATGCLPG